MAADRVRTLADKIAPSPGFASLIDRPGLDGRLRHALARRLTCVVAGAGFGKSTSLGRWAAEIDCAWYTAGPEDRSFQTFARGLIDALRRCVPELPADISAAVDASRGPDIEAELVRARAWAAVLAEALDVRLTGDLALVIDDAHELDGALGSTGLLEAICRQAPRSLHLVLSSRTEPPFPIERLRGQGDVLELEAADLAFTVDEVATLLGEAEIDGRDLAAPLHAATSGWPAAVRLAVEALRTTPAAERPAAITSLERPEGPLFEYLASEVFARESPHALELIRRVAPLERFTAELAGVLGVANARRALTQLARRGLYLNPGRQGGWYSLMALVREYARDQLPLSDGELREVHTTAASWLTAHDHISDAIASLAAIGDADGIAELLDRQGQALLDTGHVEQVLSAARHVPAERRDARLEALVGQAHQIRGDWEEALASFRRASGGSADLAAGVAWRMGLIHHLRGEIEAALALYERGAVGDRPHPDDALLLAWTATAHWLRGDAETCDRYVKRAHDVAHSCGDAQALAAAHTVRAMHAALIGDRRGNDEHYRLALGHAERAGDVLQIIRIRVNRASHYMDEGLYAEALDELEVGIRLADLAGFASFRALGLNNRGEVRIHQGRFEEAIVDLEAARDIYQRLGSHSIAYALAKLGDIHRIRGERTLARGLYEEALAAAEASGDVQGLVPALAGLAVLRRADDADAALEYAERAVNCGTGLGYVTALLAKAHVLLARGAVEEARATAVHAEDMARSRRDRAGIAEALEIEAAATDDAQRLDEAARIWRDIGNPFAEARTELALARATGGTAGRALAERAEREFRNLGARSAAHDAGALLAELDREALPPVAIESLGGFRVIRGGEPVAASEWQSKKARDLLKMLLARRGRPTPRDQLMEALWPEEPPDKLANRLSVAMTTIRALLDPDKLFPAEHFIAADKSTVRLHTENLAIDVERFLGDAAEAFAHLERGSIGEARQRLAAAEAVYVGDFLEEDAYEDWAATLREEAREVYVRVARTLAGLAVDMGEQEQASRYYLRILERDTYDEQAHLGLIETLVATGRHGEARRRYRTYCARMEEIGVESAAFPENPRRAFT